MSETVQLRRAFNTYFTHISARESERLCAKWYNKAEEQGER
jgi:hypothetical protein